MAAPDTYVIQLARSLAQAIGDSRALWEEFSTDAMGLHLPTSVTTAAPVASALQEAQTAADNVEKAGADVAAATAGSELQVIAAFVELGAALTQFYLSLDRLVTAVRTNITVATVPDADERAAAQQFAIDLAKTLSDLILGAALTQRAPQIAFVLSLLGLLDWRRIPKQGGNPLSTDHVLRRLQLDRFKDLISDPRQHYENALHWGAPDFDPVAFFDLWVGFWAPEVEVETDVAAGEPFLRQGMFRITRDSATSPPSLTLSFEAELDAEFESRREISPEWAANVKSGLMMAGIITGRLAPPLNFSLQPPDGSVTGELRAFFDRNVAKRPFDILGGIGLLSLTAENLTLGAALKAQGNSSSNTAAINPLMFADLDGLTLKIGSSDADSFVASLLASAEIEGHFDLGLEWQADLGLRVKASGGIEVALPIHRQLGPIEFETVYLALRILADGTLSLEISTALNGKLGPLSASVDRIGALLDTRFVDAADADFGPFDVSLRFKPPSGIGLAIDAGVVKGGGYVYLDPEKGEYAGALELTVSDWLSLKAIGLINTKMPGGQPGFSLLVIITAQFNPGLQLGFGFTLFGVGGLVGLNRSVLLDPLVQGVRTGAVNSILFPTNVIENAPKIISDLRAIFPPEHGIFLIGPMAKIGWGTPTLITVALGVIIEIPGNVAILGRLRVALPTDDESAVLVLQVSFVGALEFDKRRLWFFATLYESHVLFIGLAGEMGLLMDFSDSPNSVLSVGGFHPRFTAPPLPFPSPARISLAIVNERYARLYAETYFAVTTNSVQMGCKADAFFGFDAFSVEGYLTFDALLRFSPLYLIVEVSSGFSVKVFGAGVWSVHLRGSLEGPTPWHVRGSAEIDVLFFSFSVDVDVTFGETRRDTLPPIEVLPKVRAEFEKLESWRATLPASGQLCVTLRDLGSTGLLVLHPVGTLQISQRFAPLNLTLDKIGNQKPSDVKRLGAWVQSGALAVKGAVREKFAAAHYRDMSDAEKLSAPAYEPLESGVELGAAGQSWATGPMVQRNVRYETIILDTAFESVRVRFFKFWDGLFAHFRAGAAVARTPVSQATRKQLVPFESRVTIEEDRYTVAWQADNSAQSGSATFGSHAEATAHMARITRMNPALADTLHVIPSAELKQAA